MAITIRSVETVNGQNQITDIFAPFTDLLVLRVVFDLSNDLASLPGLQAHITFVIIAAQSNQAVASVRTSANIPTGREETIVWTGAQTPDAWGLTGKGDIFGLRVTVVLNSEQQQLDAFAVSDFRWFRLIEQFKL